MSPYSVIAKSVHGLATYGQRKAFVDLREGLKAHVDFDRIRQWGPLDRRPILVIGAANVLTGRMQKFISRQDPIQVEHILASCAVPNIFPAVQIGHDAYWDGLFSDNPPVESLVRPRYVGEGNIPQELWLIKIEPTSRSIIPTEPDEILDRRKQMEGNVSLFHQLQMIELLNDMYMWRAFTPEFLKSFEWKEVIRIPKLFAEDPDKPYHIPHIEMSAELYEQIDWEAKLDRAAENIEMLMEDGRKRAREFLVARRSIVAGDKPPTDVSRRGSYERVRSPVG